MKLKIKVAEDPILIDVNSHMINEMNGQKGIDFERKNQIWCKQWSEELCTLADRSRLPVGTSPDSPTDNTYATHLNIVSKN